MFFRTLTLSLIGHVLFLGLLVALEILPSSHFRRKSEMFVMKGIPGLPPGPVGGAAPVALPDQDSGANQSPAPSPVFVPTPAPTPYPTPIGTPVEIQAERVIKRTPTPKPKTPKPEVKKVTPAPTPVSTPKKTIKQTPEPDETAKPTPKETPEEEVTPEPTPRKTPRDESSDNEAAARRERERANARVTPPPLNTYPRVTPPPGNRTPGAPQGNAPGQGAGRPQKLGSISAGNPGVGQGVGPNQGGGGGDPNGLPFYYADTARARIREVLLMLPYQRQSRTCEVAFTVLRTGVITDVKVLRSSGDSALDQVGVMALERTKELAPLPRDYPQPSVRLSVDFDFSISE